MKNRKGNYGRKYEDSVCSALEEAGQTFKRSGEVKIPYTDQPALYMPDIVIEKPGIPYMRIMKQDVSLPLDDINIYIEVKSWLDYEDQRKMKNVKRCNPLLDIRFIFKDAHKKLSTSNMTHAEWAEKYHFPWAQGEIPAEWYNDTK